MRSGRLNALTVARASEPGLYADGAGLYLQVTGEGGRSWLFRFMLRGRARTMGLGPLHSVGLREARALAAECRKLLHAGIDPVEDRRAKRAEAGLAAAKGLTFQQCADAYIAAHRAGWRNPKHGEQWAATLKAYAAPIFGALPVQAVDTGLVMKVLDPIWTEKPETASRVRGRVEAVLDWATVRGYRRGENPARWRGHLDKLLPKKTKVRAVEHHPALPYAEAPSFMSELHGQDGIAALALQFCILTATRTGEVIGARWTEIEM